MSFLYDDFVTTLSSKFIHRLNEISAVYNFDLGDEFEIAVCQLLREFLPNKYGVCRGFVVNSAGDLKGDDIIIYDQNLFPTLRINPKNDFSKKEKIPIEAVYAYIEAKHRLDENTFDTAVKQIQEVKKLILSRDKVHLRQVDPYLDPDFIVAPPENLPPYRNPVFCGILSKFSINITGQHTEDKEKIKEFLAKKQETMKTTIYNPEMIVAGKDNLMCTGYQNSNGESIPTTFVLDKPLSGYQNLTRDNITFGIALCQIMTAVDYIRLGKMPWVDILNNAKLK
jgi:hypothetical protein